MITHHLDQVEALRREYEVAFQRELLARRIIAPGQRALLTASVQGKPLTQTQREILSLPAREYFSAKRIAQILQRERDVWRVESAVGRAEEIHTRDGVPFSLERFLETCGERELSQLPNVGKLAILMFKEVLARDGLELVWHIPRK